MVDYPSIVASLSLNPKLGKPEADQILSTASQNVDKTQSLLKLVDFQQNVDFFMCAIISMYSQAPRSNDQLFELLSPHESLLLHQPPVNSLLTLMEKSSRANHFTMLNLTCKILSRHGQKAPLTEFNLIYKKMTLCCINHISCPLHLKRLLVIVKFYTSHIHNQIKVHTDQIVMHHLPLLYQMIDKICLVGITSYDHQKELIGAINGLRCCVLAANESKKSPFFTDICDNMSVSIHAKIFYLACVMRGSLAVGHTELLDRMIKLIDQLNDLEFLGLDKAEAVHSCYTNSKLSVQVMLSFVNQSTWTAIEHCLFRSLLTVKRETTALFIVDLMIFLATRFEPIGVKWAQITIPELLIPSLSSTQSRVVFDRLQVLFNPLLKLLDTRNIPHNFSRFDTQFIKSNNKSESFQQILWNFVTTGGFMKDYSIILPESLKTWNMLTQVLMEPSGRSTSKILAIYTSLRHAARNISNFYKYATPTSSLQPSIQDTIQLATICIAFLGETKETIETCKKSRPSMMRDVCQTSIEIITLLSSLKPRISQSSPGLILDTLVLFKEWAQPTVSLDPGILAEAMRFCGSCCLENGDASQASEAILLDAMIQGTPYSCAVISAVEAGGCVGEEGKRCLEGMKGCVESSELEKAALLHESLIGGKDGASCDDQMNQDIVKALKLLDGVDEDVLREIGDRCILERVWQSLEKVCR